MKSVSTESIISNNEDNLEDTRWDTGTSTNSRSFALESWSYIQHKNYHLQFLQKKEMLTQRSIIPATMLERFSYFRSYASTPIKSQIIRIHQEDFNMFLWFYIFNLFLKSLPTAYVTLFLSSYASEDHLYLSKMFPFFSGTSLLIVISGFFELVFSCDYIVLLFHYSLAGVLHKNPWNRCVANKTNTYASLKNISCYTLRDFAAKMKNQKAEFYVSAYRLENGEIIQMSPLIYFRRISHIILNKKNSIAPIFLVYYIIVWTVAAFHYKALFTRYFWKSMYIIQWAANIIYIIAMLHLIYSYFDREPSVNISNTKATFSELIWQFEVDFLAESISAPPVVHVLTSRSTEQINPGRDSGLLTASNGIYYLFRGALSYQLKLHCEYLSNVKLRYSQINPYPWFYLWPIYLSTFYFGNIYTILFFASNFLLELVTFTITYQCLVEVIICEWPKIRRWMVTIALCVCGVLLNFITVTQTRLYLYVHSKGFVTLVEVVVICMLYPLGRLIDDITFHTGSGPTDIRILSFKMVPVYYIIKLYSMCKGLINVTNIKPLNSILYLYVLLITLGPLVIGMIYTTINHVCVRKENWKILLRPMAYFGPRNHINRQLRKQYDRREYICSQSSRYLSRYLMAKAEADTYKLDIKYDKNRRSTMTRSID